MLDATLRERARGPADGVGRSSSAVHGEWMLMAARRASKRPAAMSFTWKWDNRRLQRRKTAISALMPALDAEGGSTTFGAGHALAARAQRQALPRDVRLRVDAERSSSPPAHRAHSSWLSCHVPSRGDRVRGDGPRLSAVSPYPHRARLRAGADRDVSETRHALTGEALLAAHRKNAG